MLCSTRSRTAADLTTRVNRVELNGSDGTVDTFTNTMPTGWPAFSPPAGDTSLLSRNPDGTWTLLTPDGATYSFNGEGALTTVARDEAVNSGKAELTYAYDAAAWPPKLTTITDPLGRPVTLTWDASFRLDFITGWDGRTTDLGYLTANNRLYYVRTPAGRYTHFSYRGSSSPNHAGTLATIRNARSKTTTFGKGGPLRWRPHHHRRPGIGRHRPWQGW